LNAQESAVAHLLADAGTGSVSAVYGRQPIGAGSLFAQWRQLKQECSFIQSATKQFRSMHENKSFGGQLQCQQPEDPLSSNSNTIRSNFRTAFIVNSLPVSNRIRATRLIVE
jgi:hypothetical protein